MDFWVYAAVLRLQYLKSFKEYAQLGQSGFPPIYTNQGLPQLSLSCSQKGWSVVSECKC